MKNSKIFKYVLATVIVLSALAYAIDRASPPSQEKIVIGAVLHLTGDQAETARAFREGMELAAEQVNVRLIVEDSRLEPKTAHDAAVKLIEVDKVDAAIDASFLEIMANGKLFNDAYIPVITLWDSNKSIEDIGPYAFGIGIWTPSAGEESARFAYDRLNARKAVIITIQNEWSQSVGTYFKDGFRYLGGTIVGEFTLGPNTKDFRTTISKMKALDADVVYAPVTDGVVQFYEQLRQLGMNKPVITSDIITNEHIGASPGSFEGIYQTQALDPHSTSTMDMISRYRQKFGQDPKQILFTAWGYDAINILAQASEKGGRDGEAIERYLHSQVKAYQGASGAISINERGSSPKMESMFQIQKGVFVPVD